MTDRLASIRNSFAAALLAAAAFTAPAALAEQTTPNPLRPKPAETRRPAPEQAKPEAAKPEAAKPDAEAAKPRRERSAAQKQNDEMMRACGQEWRAEKTSLQAKGETWRNFLKDCRAKKKAEIRA